ncbi:hypothetical protein C8R48DRAFT_778617 [Suillus tomentosus]|nr:hypothetical protein C8R48DRAFT_778617 [Suillus tomentosus]
MGCFPGSTQEAYISAYWPCGLPVDALCSLSSTDSTSSDLPQPTIFDRLAEGTSTEAPVQRVPVTSATPTISRHFNRHSFPTRSRKAKETPDSDVEEPSASPAQVASQITAILSRSETLLADFQFPEHALSLLLGAMDDASSFRSRVVRDVRCFIVPRVEQVLEELLKSEGAALVPGRQTLSLSLCLSSSPRSRRVLPLQISTSLFLHMRDASIEVSIKVAIVSAAEPSATSSASLPTAFLSLVPSLYSSKH